MDLCEIKKFCSAKEGQATGWERVKTANNKRYFGL